MESFVCLKNRAVYSLNFYQKKKEKKPPKTNTGAKAHEQKMYNKNYKNYIRNTSIHTQFFLGTQLVITGNENLT